MITLTPTRDTEFIDRVIHDPAIVDSMTDDASVELKNVSIKSVIDLMDGVFLKVQNDGIDGGLFVLSRIADRVYEIHTAMLESCRGASAVKAGRALIQWAFKNLPCDKLTSFAWSDSPHVLRYAVACGLRPDKTEDYPATRHGRKVTITHLSISRSEFNPQ